jgi:D-alanine-D-alanine ligase
VNPASARVAVCFGGPSPEHDVSILTGLQAAHELRRRGRDVVALYWSKVGTWHRVSPDLEGRAFVDGVPAGAEAVRLLAGEDGGFVTSGGRLGRPRALPIDVVVVCCHGGPGEDGSLQGALDVAGLAYTGPTVAGAALGMDKLAFAGTVMAAGLPSLPRRLLASPPGRSPASAGAGSAGGGSVPSSDRAGSVHGGPGSDGVGLPGGASSAVDQSSFDGPYIVKPRFGGSSLGIDVVADWPTAVARLHANPHLRRGAVVEPYRPDLFDLNVAVRRWPEAAVSAIERPLRSSTSGEILGYADKYVGGEGMASAPRQLPAELDPDVEHLVRHLAAQVAELCQVRGVARVDFLSDGREVWVNELNTVPGSLARYLWVAPPIAFGDLLDDMVAEALDRPAAQHTATGADGTVLRGASAIAAKLA